MSVRKAVMRLERMLRPASLARRWLAVLRDVDRIMDGLDPAHRPASEETLRQWAREAAATGREPGDVLAEILTANAQKAREVHNGNL
jgi:superfamily II helicase